MTDEKELMFKVKAGQLDCLAPLFEANKVRLFNYFKRMGNSPQVSEDLVQETFMRILAYRSSFNGTSSFRSWLYGIAHNTSVDHFRKHKHSINHDEFDETTMDGNATLSEELEVEQKHTLFEQALQAIPAQMREIIVLSRFEQMKYEEIAQLIDCNLNTLKSRMSLAIKRLKESYQRLSGEEIT
jgi:RNA polymerase sigma-70 factor (ECF subfamily)